MRRALNTLGAMMMGFGVALCLAFTTTSAPVRHPNLGGLTTSSDYIYVMDSNVAGAGGAGVPNMTPKIVSNCNANQPLAWDGATTHAFVCLTPPGSDPLTITSASSGFGAGTLLATGIVFGGHQVTQAATITNVSIYVSVASSSTAATDVITITDGTNTCTATFNCTGTMDSSGAKNVATANGAGTGCVYAANAKLTYSATTQGCVTPPTVKNIDIIGDFP